MITWDMGAASIAMLAACSGLGIVMAFHLRPRKQTRIKEWLKQVSCRLDWSNFARKDAQLCVDLIDRWLGRRVWHWRRFAAGLVLVFLFGWVAVLVLLAHAVPVSSALFELMQPRWIAWYVLPLVVFSFSVSVARTLSRCVVMLAPSRIFGNLLLFAALSAAHYALLIYWQPLAEFMVGYFGTGAVDTFFGGTSAFRPWSPDSYAQAWAAFWRIYGPGLMTNSIWPGAVMRREIYGFDLWNSDPEYAKAYVALTSTHALGWIANFLRLAVALSLFATLVLRTMLGRPVMALWMRFGRRDKPVFTRLFGGICVAAGLLSAAMPAPAGAQEDVYRGATIRLVIALPPGASYDDVARLTARHLGAHIPGRPKIVAENMPGATGRVAASYLFNAAPKDGTVLAALHESVALAQLLRESGVRYDAREIGWLGSAVQPDDVVTLWHSAGVTSIAEAKVKALILGATTATANNFIYPTLANNLLGTRFSIVVGYEGGNAIDLAMERGEVQGRGANSWNTWKADHPDWIREAKIVPVLQASLEKHPDLPDVPRFVDLAPDARARAVLELVSASAGIARPVAAPPGVAPERLAILRRAFAAMTADPDFLADAARLHEEVRPVPGEELARRVRLVLDAPPEEVALLKASMQGKSVGCKSLGGTGCGKD